MADRKFGLELVMTATGLAVLDNVTGKTEALGEQQDKAGEKAKHHGAEEVALGTALEHLAETGLELVKEGFEALIEVGAEWLHEANQHEEHVSLLNAALAA